MTLTGPVAGTALYMPVMAMGRGACSVFRVQSVQAVYSNDKNGVWWLESSVYFKYVSPQIAMGRVGRVQSVMTNGLWRVWWLGCEM